jgi:hypothetical protein
MASAGSDSVPTGKNIDPVLWRRHDYFNIFCLPIVFITNLFYLFTCPHTDIVSVQYKVQFYIFLVYITTDVVWLTLFPKSVPAPALILVHHVVCIICWTIPLYWDSTYADISSELCVVEVNTWILTLRRHWKGKYVSSILEVLFYITWVAIRNIYYPYKLLQSVPRYMDHSKIRGGYVNDGLFFFCLLILMNYLNTKWTWDLIKSKLLKKVQ